MEQRQLNVSEAIQFLDTGLGRPYIDDLANTYGHIQMGLLSNEALQKQIEHAAGRHPELRVAIDMRREWWENN